MIHFIGTSHVSRDSVTQITQYISEHKPEFVLVELDKQRYEALVKNAKPDFSFTAMRRMGIFGFTFMYISYKMQQYIGKKTGSKPGMDMLTAIQKGKEFGLKVGLIDQPIHITSNRISKAINIFTFFQMAKDFFYGIIFRKKFLAQTGFASFDVTKTPDEQTVQNIIKFFESRYPKLYKVLIEERNIYMRKKIELIQNQFPNSSILVVVGAGHVPGMK